MIIFAQIYLFKFVVMRLLYDSQIFINQKTGGISRYHYELYKRMVQSGESAVISGRFIKNMYLLNDSNLKHSFFSDSTASFSFLNKLTIKKTVLKGNYDIFHPTIPCDYFVDLIPENKKVVLTIHDMIIEKQNPEAGATKRKLALRADKIITVSQATKNDVVEMWAIDEKKIEVIHLGSSLKPLSANNKNIANIPSRYILYVGDRGGYKNFEKFAQAFVSVQKKENDLKMVVVGRPFSQVEKQYLSELNIDNDVFIFSGISDENLTYLYSNATLFVFPSLCEGFGVPILETWTCNTPLALSDIPCFREVAGDGGCFFNPESVESMIDTICEILSNETLKNDLVKKGTERLKNFSWDKNHEQTRSVYESIL